MPKYSFTALSLDGTRIAGTQDAATLGDVHLHLAERDLLPIQVAEKKSILQYEITKKRVKPRDLMHFSRQLGVFIRAGIPIINALEVISLEMTDKVFKPALEDIMDMLRSGSTFSAAASRHEEVFPPFYLGILRSAEVTGNLDVALDELADYLDRDIDVRQKVKSALVYPIIVLGMAVVVVLILTLFVLPRFETFFDSFHAKLPLPTRMLLSVANFMGHWGWLIAAIIVGSVIGAVVYFRTPNGRARKDALLLRVPVFGDLLEHAIVERFCRILASMMNAGVPVPEALAVTGDATNNSVFRERIARGARCDVARGGPGDAAEQYRPVPALDPADVPGRRGHGLARPATRDGSQLSGPRARLQDQALHELLRARRHHLRRRSRGLRRHRARLRHVRRVQPGQRHPVTSNMHTVRARGDAGLTFTELLAAIMILGVCVVFLLGGTTFLPIAASTHRQDAQVDAMLRNWAEAVKAKGFDTSGGLCAPDTYSIDALKSEAYLPSDFSLAGFTSSAPVVDTWDGSTFVPCSPGTALLARVGLTLTSSQTAHPVSQSLEVVVGRP